MEAEGEAEGEGVMQAVAPLAAEQVVAGGAGCLPLHL